MLRFWCMKCQHGVEGIEGAECPDCLSRGYSDPGVLMTPQDAEKKTRERAEAIKLTRHNKAPKPYKSMDDIKAELREELKKELLAELKNTVTVETKPVEVKKGPGRPKKSPVGSESTKTLDKGGE